MSAAAAVIDATEAPKKKKGSKKLFLILGIVGLVLALAGGGAFWFMQKRAAEAAAAAAAEEEEGDDSAQAGAGKPKAKKDAPVGTPTFLPIEPFVVNLADREQERFAQIAVSLQVDDAKVADQLKLYMPAIRNGILMVLAHKTSAELLERAGKEMLAAEIMRESVRPLGIEIDDVAAAEPQAPSDDGDAAPKGKKKPKKPAVHNPVVGVHFSSFIIQ